MSEKQIPQALAELRDRIDGCWVKIEIIDDPSITVVSYVVGVDESVVLTASDFGGGTIDEVCGDQSFLPLVEACQDCLNDLLSELNAREQDVVGSEDEPFDDFDERFEGGDGSKDEYVLCGLDLLEILTRIYRSGKVSSQLRR